MTETSLPTPEGNSIKYFARLGFQVRQALKVHKAAGLWNPEDDWRNVTKHCLVQVARVIELSNVLGLSSQTRRDMMMGATLHDINKKAEIIAGRKAHANSLSVWDAFEEAAQEKKQRLQQAGFSENVIRLANAAPHGSIVETEEVLKKDELTESDIAFLVLHYIDDISVEDKWVGTARGENGAIINQLDNRLVDPIKPVYLKLDEEGKDHFNGKTTWQAARRVGHMVETKLAELVNKKMGTDISPKNLPELIDQKVVESINSTK